MLGGWKVEGPATGDKNFCELFSDEKAPHKSVIMRQAWRSFYVVLDLTQQTLQFKDTILHRVIMSAVFEHILHIFKSLHQGLQ